MLSVFGNGSLFGERVGSEKPDVLLLHGWRGDHSQMANIASNYNAISLDLPGFGASLQPTEVWGASEYADAISCVLDEFESPPVVVGYSFGGRVAVCLAAKHLERIRSVVLVGVPLIRKSPAKKPPMGFRIAKFANRMGVISDDYIEKQRQKRGSADYRSAKGIMRDIFVKVVNESYESQITQIKCKVEMVWGERDTEAPMRNANEAQRLFADSEISVVPDGTHWSVVQDPKEVQKVINRCLSPS